MSAKKLSVCIIAVVLILFGAIASIVYDKSEGVDIICYAGSYAEEYAEEHNLDCELISNSDAYIGVLNLENFDYNYEDGKGEIVSYSGDSETLAIPADIEGNTITKVTEKAFENAKNLKKIYIPKTVTEFAPKNLDNVTVYLYEDSALYKALSKDKEIKFTVETIPDSYYVNFYTANIPFQYNNISEMSVELTKYTAADTTVLIPESIDGKVVTTISFDALSSGVETIIIPKSVTGIKGEMFSGRYDMDFVIGLLMAVIGTAVAIVFVLTLRVDTKEKMFLTVSQFKTAHIAALLSVILAGVYLFVPVVPDLVVYVALVLVYGFAVIAVIKAKTAVALVEGIDEKIKVQTFFVKELTVDADHLVSTAKTAELKVLAKKVYEAVRYSDPMSNAVLVEVEDKIRGSFSDFEGAVAGEDYELAASNADELLSLIDIRNKKCKLLK